MSLDSVNSWFVEFMPGNSLIMGVVVFGLSFCTMLLFAQRDKRAQMSSQTHDFASDAGIVFQFIGQSCTAMTPTALAFLGDAPSDPPWKVIVDKFRNRALEAALIDLTGSGLTFRQTIALNDETYFLVEGRPVQGVCEVTFLDITQSHREKLNLEAKLAVAQQELVHTRKVLDEVPALSWIEGPNGELIWSNPAYNSVCVPDEEADQPPYRFRPDDLRRLPVGEETRLAVFDENEVKTWYGVTKTLLEMDQALFVAVAASKIVDAEQTLHRFICTLTETFAHIPIGLAVFDADRSLSMFNPALSELLSIDPAWLAARPDFIGFLERLREQRKMPEARDFVAWREKINAIARSAKDGDFCEDWDLPGGQTLRVTGSPHPKGAMALLFEDVSIAKSLEQKFRGQIDLSETILATLSEGVAVFDTAGGLVFSNPSFETIWGFDPKSVADAPTIHDVKLAFDTRSSAQSLFTKALDFVTHTGQRTSWRAQFDTIDGRTILGQFAPLPDGSSLMAFLDVTKTGATLGEITSAYSQLVADRQNERDLVGLSLEHLKLHLSRQDRVDGRDLQADLGEKLNMLEGLLLETSAPTDPDVSTELMAGDLSKALASGRNRGLDISSEDADVLQEVFEAAGLGPNFLNSVLVLVGALIAAGGKASLRGNLAEKSAGFSVIYETEHAADLEGRRFSLVVALLRELALKHDIALTLAPGNTDGSVEAAFNFPVSPTALRRLHSQIA